MDFAARANLHVEFKTLQQRYADQWARIRDIDGDV
jgi:hypothetical protein